VKSTKELDDTNSTMTHITLNTQYFHHLISFVQTDMC